MKSRIADMLGSLQRRIEQVEGQIARGCAALDGTPFIVAGDDGRGLLNLQHDGRAMVALLPLDLLGVPHFTAEKAAQVAATLPAESGALRAIDYRQWLALQLRELRGRADMLAQLARE